MEDVCVEPVDSDIEIAIRSRDEMESSGFGDLTDPEQ